MAAVGVRMLGVRRRRVRGLRTAGCLDSVDEGEGGWLQRLQMGCRVLLLLLWMRRALRLGVGRRRRIRCRLVPWRALQVRLRLRLREVDLARRVVERRLLLLAVLLLRAGR